MILLFLTGLIASAFLGFGQPTSAQGAAQLAVPDLKFTRVILQNSRADFWEANLGQMKMKLYEQGRLKAEFPIYRRGDAADWGGTPVGLYRIESKDGLVFSSAADVWMPYSMKFYGKYYLHGEPYYPSGAKYQNPVSGGCIEFKDDIAKKIFTLSKKGMYLLVIDQENDSYFYQAKAVEPLNRVEAKSFFVADIGSGAVLTQRNAREVRPVGSLTALMTAVVMTENTNLKKTVTLRQLANPQEQSVVKLNQRFPLASLFYPLLVESSFNAAKALSTFWGTDKTVKWMNDKAVTVLMFNSQFTDLSGASINNVSTAQDIFLLARYITQTRTALWSMSKAEKFRTLGSPPFALKVLSQRNIAPRVKELVGAKTAYNDAAGYSGVFVFRFELLGGQSRQIGVVILDTPDLIKDSSLIHQWVLQNYFNNDNFLVSPPRDN